MEAETISVIIPVYNSSCYLNQCLQSVLSQTYKELEIILVDDGSTDDSYSICLEFQRKDKRVLAMRKENAGQSEARNDGLKLATGKYIGFVDSDDEISPNYFEVLYSALMETETDIAACGYKKDGKSSYAAGSIRRRIIKGDDLCRAVLVQHQLGVTPWAKLFRREVIGETRFCSGRIYEDDLFCFQVFSRCNSVVILDDPLYIYTVNTDGTTYGSYSEKAIDILPISLLRLQVIEKRWPRELSKAIYRSACSFIDVHVDYAYRRLTENRCFREKLMRDREELYSFFIAHDSLIDSNILVKLKYYYKNPGSIMLRDKARLFRNRAISETKRIMRKLYHERI